MILDGATGSFVMINVCPVLMFGFVITLSLTYLVLVDLMARLVMIRSPVLLIVLILSLFPSKLSIQEMVGEIVSILLEVNGLRMSIRLNIGALKSAVDGMLVEVDGLNVVLGVETMVKLVVGIVIFVMLDFMGCFMMLNVAMGGFVMVLVVMSGFCPVALNGFVVRLLVMAIVSTQMVLGTLVI
jgi:hypothetical protein